MKYRSLGNTDLSVSTIGFGAWGIGGKTSGNTSYGRTNDENSLASLEAALDLGITFYDTAPAYGSGNSENLIGKAFKNRRDKVVIATKVGYQNWREPADFRPDSIQRSVEGSLKRLQSDYIDLLQLHNASGEIVVKLDDTRSILEKFVSEGVIKAWGVSVKTPSDGLWAIEKLNAQTIQANINMLDMRVVTSGLLDAVLRNGVGLIARTPLCFGFLGGELTPESKFSSGDHRNNWSQAQKEVWLEGADKMFKIADRNKILPAAETALRFCLSVPGVSCTIPGILSKKDVIANARAGESEPIDPKIYQKILDMNSQSEFFLPKDLS